MELIDIGEVAARSGTAPSTLRYYEDVGLISSATRRGLRRQFPARVLLQLKLIALGKLAGFSLDEISGMYRAGGALKLPRSRLRQKADDLDRQLRELTRLRDTLRHVADCRAPSHMECPTFRRLVDAAGKRNVRAKKKAPRKPRRGRPLQTSRPHPLLRSDSRDGPARDTSRTALQRPRSSPASWRQPANL
jgi:DNA-binding transcriptional MerR regulator